MKTITQREQTSMTFKSQHISVSINRPADEVYAFAANPENLPKWAAGLSGSIKNVNGDWIAESPMGKVKVKFADKNEFGILDHDVTLPSGVKFYNPMRVFPNNDSSELVFTLYQRPGVTDQMLAEDAAAVIRDLEKLKTLLENSRSWSEPTVSASSLQHGCLGPKKPDPRLKRSGMTHKKKQGIGRQ